MKRNVIAAACSLGLISSVLTIVFPAVADTAAPSDTGASGLPTIAITQPAPEGSTVATASDLPGIQALDIDTALAVSEIVQTDIDRSINTVSWDSTRDVVLFYVYGEASALTRTIASQLPEDQAWEVIPSARSASSKRPSNAWHRSRVSSPRVLPLFPGLPPRTVQP